LRKWFEERCQDEVCTFEVREGEARFGVGTDIRVIDIEGGPSIVRAADLKERIVQCLVDEPSLPPRALEEKLGVSRSALNQALRVLMASGCIERIGKGRSVRYKAIQRPDEDPRKGRCLQR
jgi:hypothetical protein